MTATKPEPSGSEIAVDVVDAGEPADASVAPVHPRRMLGRYEIVAEIAKGGMGTVYLARLEGAGGFERLMAVKVMHEHLAEDEAFVTMLLDEARTAANIHHPNAVGITDVAESPLGHYLVMEYVDGFPLSHVITHPELVTRDRIRVGMRLLADAAHGLHAAHTAKNAKGERLGIVHRDVSPQNVLVGTDGMARIVDFGIALAASRVASSRPGSLKGKPQYMAPEQAKGEPCDPRTDVFALGVIAWEILTYERLFFGEMDVAILVQVMECEVPSPLERDPNLPRALAETTMRALGKSPADRFATARDFAVAIERAADAAGMLASAHEVEEMLGRLFADEIQAKNDAVRAHLSRSGGPAVPLRKGELGLVSRLFTKRPAQKPHAQMATRTGVPAGPTSGSGVRERADAAIARTATNTPAPHTGAPADLAVADWTGSVATAARAAAPPRTSSLGWLGAALAIVGLVSIVIAIAVVLFARSPTPPPPSRAEAEDESAAPPATTARGHGTGAGATPGAPATAPDEGEPPTGAASRAEPVAPVVPIEPVTAPTADEDGISAAATAAPPATGPSTTTAGERPRDRGHGRGSSPGAGAEGAPVSTGTPATGPGPSETAPASTTGTTPTLEANPYH